MLGLVALLLVLLLLSALLLGSRLLLGDGSRRSDFGFTDKDGTGFDGNGGGFDIADHFGAGFDLHAVDGGDVAVNLAVDHDGFGFHFGLEMGVFSDGESSVRADFAFDATVDEKVVGEFDGSLDVDVITENVTLTTGSLAGG